ncbi:hypothetical protein BJX70DRAFT_150486 [Aspergillus crustosus]
MGQSHSRILIRLGQWRTRFQFPPPGKKVVPRLFQFRYRDMSTVPDLLDGAGATRNTAAKNLDDVQAGDRKSRLRLTARRVNLKLRLLLIKPELAAFRSKGRSHVDGIDVKALDRNFRGLDFQKFSLSSVHRPKQRPKIRTKYFGYNLKVPFTQMERELHSVAPVLGFQHQSLGTPQEAH